MRASLMWVLAAFPAALASNIATLSFPHCEQPVDIPAGTTAVRFSGLQVSLAPVEYAYHVWRDVRLQSSGGGIGGPLRPTGAVETLLGAVPCAAAPDGRVGCWVSPYHRQLDVPVHVPHPGVTLQCVKEFSPWRPAALAVGLMLLALAPVVANSAVFHYTLGVVVAVLLVLVYLWRNPRKTVSAAVLFSAIGVMRPALARDFGFAATWGLPAAAAVAGVVGIIVVYIMRPTQNERFCNVVQWTLQLIAIAVIVLCSTSEPIGRPIVAGATAAVLVFLLLFGQYLPFVSLAWTPFALCRRLFWGLKKRKFLTQEEYYAQMVAATQRGLDTLRLQGIAEYAKLAPALGPQRSRTLHDWLYFGKQPMTPDPRARASPFVVDQDTGHRYDAQDASETEDDFNRWIAENEHTW